MQPYPTDEFAQVPIKNKIKKTFGVFGLGLLETEEEVITGYKLKQKWIIPQEERGYVGIQKDETDIFEHIPAKRGGDYCFTKTSGALCHCGKWFPIKTEWRDVEIIEEATKQKYE